MQFQLSTSKQAHTDLHCTAKRTEPDLLLSTAGCNCFWGVRMSQPALSVLQELQWLCLSQYTTQDAYALMASMYKPWHVQCCIAQHTMQLT